MSSVAVQGNASGTGVITLASPNTNSSYTVSLPAAAGTLVTTDGTQTLTNKTLTSPTLTTPNIDSAQFATVSGTAPLYAARAWVNFNGTGVVAIRASGNVTSITDNGTGDYTLNFTTAMPDANYSVSGVTGVGTADAMIGLSGGTAQTASLVRFVTINSAANVVDNPQVHVQVHR